VRAVDQLVDEQPVAHEQRWDHAAGRDSVRFYYEGAEKDEEKKGAQQRLEILPEPTQRGPLRKGARLLSAPLARRDSQCALLEVLVDEPCHLEHGNLFCSTEHGAEVVVCIDHATVF
jgi:hypothetical protein